MDIFTSYYARALKDSKIRPTAVAISVTVPHYAYGISHCPELAPTWQMVSDIKAGKITVDQYIDQYRELIMYKRGLMVGDIRRLLQHFAFEGKVTMLCYEKVGDFCHRHVLADMMNRSGTHRCEEFITNKDKPVDFWSKSTEFKPLLHSCFYKQPISINL